MRNPFGSLFHGSTRPARGGGAATTAPGLKAAFQRSRAEGNIDLVWPVLRQSVLHIVVAQVQDGEPWFLTRSPNPERFCVTVAEDLDSLASIAWPKQAIQGGALVAALPPVHEIVVVYPDGGDYITREQLAWYRQLP